MQSNLFTITYFFQVDGFWIDGDEKEDANLKGITFFRFEPIMLYDYLNVSSGKKRKYPVVINHPVSLNYKVIFHFPEKLVIDDDVDIYENDAFYYKEVVEQIDIQTVQICYTLKSLTNEISAEKYPEICEQKDKIRDKLPAVFYFLK